MKKKKIFLIIGLLVAIVLVLISIKVIRNKIFLNDVEVAIRNLLENTNYSYEVNCTKGNMASSKKKVLNDKVTMEQNGSTYYADYETNELYLVSTENNTYVKLNLEDFKMLKPNVFSNTPSFFGILLSKIYNNDNSEYLRFLFKMKISNDTYEGIECYKVTFAEEETYVNKETFLPIKCNVAGEELEYAISSNEVKEDDVTFKNMQDYTENK